MSHLSNYAQHLFTTQWKIHGNEETIVDVFEHLWHDGHDEDGPKSDLWELYVVTQHGNRYTYYSFHAENWFSPTETVEYELYSSFESHIMLLFSQDQKLYTQIVHTEDGEIMDYDYNGVWRDHLLRFKFIKTLEKLGDGIDIDTVKDFLAKEHLLPSVIRAITVKIN